MMKQLLVIGVVFLTFTIQTSIMRRVLLSAKGQALCLDGTPGGYYIGHGSGENKNKFILYFEGTGWCGGNTVSETLENCYTRSNGEYGSSKNYTSTIDTTNMGILSADPAHNPAYHDWTRVFLKYCDGSGHQGTRSLPVNYKDKNLYFRGQNITIGQFEALNATQKMFTQATQIIVSGGSAGGLAAFQWTNYVADHAKGRVISIPDSGIFLNSANQKTKTNVFRNQLSNLMTFSNAQVNTPVPQCHGIFQKVYCMYAQYIWKFIKAPLFVLEPLYDSWSLQNVLGITCVKNMSLQNCNTQQRQQLEQYRISTAQTVLEIVSNKSRGNGAWAPACSNHCYAQYSYWTNGQLFSVPSNSGITAYEAVRKWQQNSSSSQNHTHIDLSPWPSNYGCSEARNKSFLTKQ